MGESSDLSKRIAEMVRGSEEIKKERLERVLQSRSVNEDIAADVLAMIPSASDEKIQKLKDWFRKVDLPRSGSEQVAFNSVMRALKERYQKELKPTMGELEKIVVHEKKKEKRDVA